MKNNEFLNISVSEILLKLWVYVYRTLKGTASFSRFPQFSKNIKGTSRNLMCPYNIISSLKNIMFPQCFLYCKLRKPPIFCSCGATEYLKRSTCIPLPHMYMHVCVCVHAYMVGDSIFSIPFLVWWKPNNDCLFLERKSSLRKYHVMPTWYCTL